MDLFEFEAVIDGVDAPAGEPAEESVEEPVVEAEAPAQPWEDPAFQEAVARAAAEEVNSRLAGLSAPEPQHAQPGEQPDWNERLNPLSDEFGSNLVQLLSERDQFFLSEVDKRFEPVRSREEQAQQSQAQQLVEQFVTDSWSEADGPLTDTTKSAIQNLALAFLDEMNQRYGQTPTAAKAALAKAADTIRAINKEARTAGSASNADQLAAIAGAAGEPGTGGGAHNVPPPAKSPQELFERRFGLGLNHN